MADTAKTRDIYSTRSTGSETEPKPLVARILTLGNYLKTLSSEQRGDPATVKEISSLVDDLTAIIGQPVNDQGEPIVFSIENPGEFLEALARMAEDILPETQINQGEIPTNLAELVEQMETQIEAEKAAKALSEKTGIKISEARKTVYRFIEEQTASIERSIKESTSLSGQEKNQFVPLARKAVPVLVKQEFEDGKQTVSPNQVLSRVKEINQKGKDSTPPVLTALEQKQESLTSELGKFASISTRVRTETIRAESKAVIDEILGNQPTEIREKVANHTAASLVISARKSPPASEKEVVETLESVVKQAVAKVDPTIKVETTVQEAIEKVNRESADQTERPAILAKRPTVEEVVFDSLETISQQPEEITREVALEQLTFAYQQTNDPKTAAGLAQSDLVLSEIFTTKQEPLEPKIVVSKEVISSEIIQTLPQEIAKQQWISLDEVEKSAPEDLYKNWFEAIARDRESFKFIAIQEAQEPPTPLSNYDPEKITTSLRFAAENQPELFSGQDIVQEGEVSQRVNFIRNLFKVWQEQTQTSPIAATRETVATPIRSSSGFSNSFVGKGLRRFGGFIRGKLSPIFNKLGGGILKKLGSTAAGQAVKGALTKLGVAAAGALSGVVTGGLSLLLAAIPAAAKFIKNIAKKLGIKLPSLKNFASKVLGVSGKGAAGALEAGAKILAGMTLSTVAIPLGAIIIGIFAILTFTSILIPLISGSALVQSELGGEGRGTEGIEGTIVDPEGNHLADRTQIAMQACGMNPVTKTNCLDPGQKQQWTTCLVGEGLSQTEAQDVVTKSCQSAESFETLQCVGYKKAVEPKFPGGHNACWFANASNQVPKQIGSVQVGDNAVWGSDCCDQCSLGKLDCCGHIGIITKVEPSPSGGEGWIYVTSAQGGTGNVNTIKVPLGNPTAILRY